MPSKEVNFIDKFLARIDRLDRTSLHGYLSTLTREKKQIEEVLDQINEGLLLLDRNGRVHFANRRAFLWLGFQRFSKDRSHIADLVEEPLVKRFFLERLRQADASATEEFEVLTPREMSLRIYWLPLEDEEESRLFVRIENLTHERAIEKDEAQTHRNEGLIRLAAGVAHEIGNPLNAIQIHLELLKSEIAKLPRQKQGGIRSVIDVIVRETKRLDEIVRSFLRATRLPPLRFRIESLNEVLQEAVEFLRPEMNKQKAVPDLHLEKGLPSFLLDRDRMRQVFINLLKNAVEAMPNGGKIQISTSFKEKLCFVRFEDEGKGIDEKDLSHLFEAYYTTKKEGSGLGLALVCQTLREHGGRIDVKSELGKGSVFTLVLPIRQERLRLPQPKETVR